MLWLEALIKRNKEATMVCKYCGDIRTDQHGQCVGMVLYDGAPRDLQKVLTEKCTFLREFENLPVTGGSGWAK